MKLGLLLIAVALIGISSCSQPNKQNKSAQFWSENNSPKVIYQKITDDLFTRNEFMMYRWGGCTAVHYSEIAAAYGIAKIAGYYNDSLTLQKLSDRYMRVIDDSIPNTKNHVDANVYGVLPLELYMQTNSQIYFDQGIELADMQWEDPQPDGLTSQTRYWIDDVWMIGALQLQAYRATGKSIYLDRAALEIAAYLKKLQEPNGLFHHGPEAPFYWGRGNGWVASGLAELLLDLPETNSQYQTILDGYKKMMAALLQYQSEDGMWRQLIDYDSAWKETSATAMFGFAMSVGVKKGILPKDPYEAAYQKAWLALTNYLNEEGKMTDVCVGTGQSQDPNYYLDRPTTTGDFHGQAPMLWFANSLLNSE